MTEHSLYTAASQAFATPLETERLIIKPWGKEDASALSDFFEADGRDYPGNWLKWPTDFSYTPDYITNTVLELNNKHCAPSGTFFLAVQNKVSGQILGEMRFYPDLAGRVRLPFYILPSQRRQGYCEEAYKAVLNHARDSGVFTHQDLHAEVEADNLASQSFLKKMGFENVGAVHSQTDNYEGQTLTGFKRTLTQPAQPEAPLRHAAAVNKPSP